MKLLLLEDDDLLADALAETLEDAGYRVDSVPSIRVAKLLMATETYALAILDLGLPDGSGLDLLVRWREQGKGLPILVLTARNTWEDKVIGLRRGADDYLTKPFHEAELLARLHALLRRKSGGLAPILRVNGIQLNEHTQKVSTNGMSWQTLTATEFRLLRFLMHHPDRVHSKAQLLDQLYSLEQDAAAPNLVEVYVGRLRKRLGNQVIQTLRGQGYLLESR